MREIVKIDKTAYLTPYLIQGREDSDGKPIRRPLVLVLPGGAYRYVSGREGEPVALRANSYGFHSVVLNYTCLPDKMDLSKDVVLQEVEQALDWIDQIDASYYVDHNKIFVMGFSAGGHLAAWSSIKFSKRIHGVVLGYGAIAYTREQLEEIFSYTLESAGRDFTEEELLQGKQMLNIFEDAPIHSLHKDVPRTFLFHTLDDATVPGIHSLQYTEVLHALGVPVELHLYESGVHGLSLADQTSFSTPASINSKVSNWFEMAVAFLMG